MAVEEQRLFCFSGIGLSQLTVAKEHLIAIALKWASSAPETSSVTAKFQLKKVRSSTGPGSISMAAITNVCLAHL